MLALNARGVIDSARPLRARAATLRKAWRLDFRSSCVVLHGSGICADPQDKGTSGNSLVAWPETCRHKAKIEGLRLCAA